MVHYTYMRIIFGLMVALVLVGAGCGEETVADRGGIVPTPDIARSFTFDEIEMDGGGIQEWMSSLIGQNKRVRLPVISVYGFACETPTQYCVSTINGGCYGPFVQFTGNTELIDARRNACAKTCDNAEIHDLETAECSLEFTDKNCAVMWDVEGTITAGAPPNPVLVDERCSAGEPVYTINVDRVVGPIDALADEFEIREYR